MRVRINIYEIVLNVSIAGLPFAIATMVAKYNLKEQYKTLLLVRKLSTAILALLGFVAMMVMILLAHPIAQFSVSGAYEFLGSLAYTQCHVDYGLGGVYGSFVE